MIGDVAGRHMLRVGERFGGNGSDVRMLTRVEDEVPLPTLRHEAELAKLSKVLRHRRRGSADVLGEVVD